MAANSTDPRVAGTFLAPGLTWTGRYSAKKMVAPDRTNLLRSTDLDGQGGILVDARQATLSGVDDAAIESSTRRMRLSSIWGSAIG